MSRLRVLTALSVLTVTALLAPASTAAAAPMPLAATITCNPARPVITTSIAGALFTPGTAPTEVSVEFTRRSSIRVTAAGLSSAPPQAPVVVTTTSTSAGEIAAFGYTARFDPVATFFLREIVAVTVTNAATGAVLATRDATCYHDRRTTVSLTCDPAAGTVTAAISGWNGVTAPWQSGGWPSRIGYFVESFLQSTPEGPGFVSHPGDYEVVRNVSRAADGSWTDPGYVHAITSRPYRYGEDLTVDVFDAMGQMVGHATAGCTLY